MMESTSIKDSKRPSPEVIVIKDEEEEEEEKVHIKSEVNLLQISLVDSFSLVRRRMIYERRAYDARSVFSRKRETL